ncbi:AcrR family transcriptional regulator [Aurantimicrobium minutum]|uniref:TetR/AcrR family transcriptional regulator n=1 Tax=Aurantimicrobium minutum TaxID=708131 RepID=UPI002475C00B|nr:TetR/AcrR family transcriptional regulator [Aurantimicrobium minutum]MDH6277721.1 AcrR family transcriptional regulator [Aurantimicrobium minutum]
MAEPLHPTAEKLMQAVSEMLNSDKPHDILVDEVLKRSGVQRGSLYHFFGDFPSLVRSTLLHRFSANVSADGAAMLVIAENATSKEDYWKRIRALSAITQVPERAAARAERARLISLASSDTHFAAALAVEQQNVTDAVSKAIATAQKKGWVDQQLNPDAIAVFLQAYSLGRSVDDVSTKQIDNASWQLVVDAAIGAFEASS